MLKNLLFYAVLPIFIVKCSIILTSSGPVRGALLEYEGSYYHAYRGIPYAESPEGEMRFKPPVPVKPWTEPFDATQEGPMCPQKDRKGTQAVMSEDCLRINVFVPANNSTNRRPALFFIHGGSFRTDSANSEFILGPELLMQKDIIVVTANFRLGAIGFLSFGVEEASGNAGIKDIIQALKWFNENIDIFGGSTITVGGVSSGAALAQLLLLTEKTSGLFQRAILLGGCANNPRSFTKYPVVYAKYLAEKLGIATDNIYTAIKNLTNTNIYDILEAQEDAFNNERRCHPVAIAFRPSIEINSSHAVITQDPIKIIKAGIPQSVPILVTGTSEEGLRIILSNEKDPIRKFAYCIPTDLEYPIESDEFKMLVNDTATFYFGDKGSKFCLKNYVDMLTDTQYAYAANTWIKLHTKNQNSKPVYYAIFNYTGPINYSKFMFSNTFDWVSHSDEINYVFTSSVTRPLMKNLDARTKRVVNLFTGLISNFVKYGNPTPDDQDGDLIWPPYGEKGCHLLLDDNPKVVQHRPFEKRSRFWDNVYKKYYSYVQHGGVIQPNYYF